MHKARFFVILIIVFSACSDKRAPVSDIAFVKVPGFNIAYEERGKGLPVLLLHAGLQNHKMWDEQVEAFSKEYRIIAIDLPFHGDTEGVDTTVLVQDVILTVLDSLKAQNAVVIGLSMGGACALDFAIAHPERVSKLVLVASGMNGVTEEVKEDSLDAQWYTAFNQAVEQKDSAKAARTFTKAWSIGHFREDKNLELKYNREVYNTTLATIQKHKLKGFPKLNNETPSSEYISSLTMPVLVVNGDKDLPIITDIANFLDKHLQNSKHIVIKDVAHMLNLEKPKEFNEIVLSFLKEK